MVSKFKYAESCSQSYAPGYSIPGNNGDAGSQGNNGNGIFYISYELNNSYIIDLTLQKIDNNQVLSDDNVYKLAIRPYKLNDILISSKGTVYRLISSKTTDHNFGIEEIGKTNLSGLGEIPEVLVKIYDYTGYTVQYGNDVILDMSTNISTCVPSNRCRKFTPNASEESVGTFNSDDFLNRGAWYKITLVSSDTSAADTDIFEYDLKMYFHNEKIYQYNTIPCKSSEITEENPDPMVVEDASTFKFNFEKILNIQNVKCNIINEEEFKIGKNDISELEIPLNMSFNNNEIEDNFTTIFLSDMTMDKIFFKGNNIRSTLGTYDEKYYYYDTSTSSKVYNTLALAQEGLNKCETEKSTNEFLQSSYVVENESKVFNIYAGTSSFFSKMDPSNVHTKINDLINSCDVILIVKNKKTNNVLYKKIGTIIIDTTPQELANKVIIINE